jgi:hypothetical protein
MLNNIIPISAPSGKERLRRKMKGSKIPVEDFYIMIPLHSTVYC